MVQFNLNQNLNNLYIRLFSNGDKYVGMEPGLPIDAFSTIQVYISFTSCNKKLRSRYTMLEKSWCYTVIIIIIINIVLVGNVADCCEIRTKNSNNLYIRKEDIRKEDEKGNIFFSGCDFTLPCKLSWKKKL